MGIHAADDGRSCAIHSDCGKNLQIDSVICFCSIVVEKEGSRLESAIDIHMLIDGSSSCWAGYLQHSYNKYKHNVLGQQSKFVKFLKKHETKAAKARSARFWKSGNMVII